MGRFESDFAQLGITNGMRLAVLRRIMDLKQAELAAAAGVSRSLVSMLENDRRPLTLRSARALAGPLGVSTCDLLAVVVEERARVDVVIQDMRLAHPRARTVRGW